MPVEVFEGLESAEVSGFGASFEAALVPDVEFVLEDELEELGMAEACGGGFLQAHGKRTGQARQTELAEGGFDGDPGWDWGGEGNGMR